jgi:hypothetical protein
MWLGGCAVLIKPVNVFLKIDETGPGLSDPFLIHSYEKDNRQKSTKSKKSNKTKNS